MITKKDREEAEAYCAEQDNPGHLQNRITELEGKIARAREALRKVNKEMLKKVKKDSDVWYSFSLETYIDAALKELQ